MHDFLETYLPWFTIREIPMLGNTMFHRLLSYFKTPQAILSAGEPQLCTIERMTPKIVSSLLHPEKFMNNAKKELTRIYNSNLGVVTLNDPDYPPLLKKIVDAPVILTYAGRLYNDHPCVAVVGSRAATSYGKNTAKNLSRRLSAKGFQIVSGMARGIDAMAHSGALEAGGKTIAVLGSGLNRIYPRENKQLFENIAGKGTVFSEYKLDADPHAGNFPMRNRIIAGLCCGTIVVEAARRSGSLITARLSAEYNREVFAVPGSISSAKSQGTHALLKQGARLVETEMDIIDELGQFVHEKQPDIKTKPSPALQTRQLTGNTADSDAVTLHLDPYPVHIDTLIQKSGLTPAKVSAILLELEISRTVIRHPGNFYSAPQEERH